MGSKGPRRKRAAVIAALLVAAGLVVHLAVPDSAASDIAGDVLYTALIYALVVVVAPALPPFAVAAAAAGWCVAIEIFQLTGIPNEMGARFPPVVLVLGTVFDPRDLLVAVVVSALAAGADLVVGRLRHRRSPPLPPNP